MHLRIRCHLYYSRECDEVYHPAMQLKGHERQNVFVLTDTDIVKIVEIYRVIFPLHRIFNQVCQTTNFAELAKETFYDTSLIAQGEAYEKLCQYSAAKKCYQQVVALNPEDFDAQLQLLLCFHLNQTNTWQFLEVYTRILMFHCHD